MTKASETKSEGKIINVDGVDIWYERSGSGPDVVLVHGWPLTTKTWRNIVPRLDGYTCHRFDMPGAGGSPLRKKGKHGFTSQAQVLEGAINKVGIDRCVLIGNDSGGVVSSLFAARRPEKVDGLIVAGSDIPGHTSILLEIFIAAARMPGKGLSLKMVLMNRMIRNSPLGLGELFVNKKNLEGEFVDHFVKPLLKDKQTRAGQAKILSDFDRKGLKRLGELQPKITAPTLFVWGLQDSIFPAAKAKKMAKKFGGTTTFVGFPDAKLLPHEEDPERFAVECNRFLESLALK